MSFVVYDVETTGLIKGFDQILHFGAIKTNADLDEVDRFEIHCRLLPHILPAPRALHITDAHIEELLDGNRPSHYAMVCEIYRAISAWCPSVFLGFNSIQFDEEFLRQAFFQCLHAPFLTNTNGNTRADVLKLARAVAALHPDVLIAPSGEDGRAIFRLGELAAANGFPMGKQHNAMADVEATLRLCRVARDGAPDLWSRFLRFAQKAAVLVFVQEENAFLLFEFFGAREEHHFLTDIGVNEEQPNTHYCLDLTLDIDALRRVHGEELVNRLKTEPRPIRRLKVNTAPLLCPLYEASATHFGEFTEDQLVQRGSSVRADGEFVQRLVAAAKACETVYERSTHVEEQLYGHGFANSSDSQLMNSFHALPWEERLAIVGQFEDARLRRLGRRLIYFERPDLLTDKDRQATGDEIGRRLLGTAKESGPWLTVPDAISGLDELLSKVNLESQARLLAYRQHLVEIKTRLENLES